MVISLSISILFLNKSAEAAELEEMYVCKFKICFSMMSSLFHSTDYHCLGQLVKEAIRTQECVELIFDLDVFHLTEIV